jgi:hypothetical protein
VLSNFWLKSEDKIAWVYNQTAIAITKFLGGFRVSESLAPEVEDIINKSKATYARSACEGFQLEVPNA